MCPAVRRCRASPAEAESTRSLAHEPGAVELDSRTEVCGQGPDDGGDADETGRLVARRAERRAVGTTGEPHPSAAGPLGRGVDGRPDVDGELGVARVRGSGSQRGEDRRRRPSLGTRPE